jgi:hypothetical protein
VDAVPSRVSAGGFDIEVVTSFANCPQHIQIRQLEFVRDLRSPITSQFVRECVLSEYARRLTRQADTFFVASYTDDFEQRQVDVSHRGGRAGSVRVGVDDELTIPDFAASIFFATLGNFC